MLVRYPVHTPVRTPMYGLPLSQSGQRIRSAFQSVYENYQLELCSKYDSEYDFDVIL